MTSEVIISPPDTREGHEEVDEGTTDEVGRFWNKMMKRFGSEKEYTDQVISQFKNGEEPEILIVVDKLLTGFDAPRNTVLYICRQLREHTLLQAITRVNRVYEGKDFGYIIDYAGILGELDMALMMYDSLTEFDEEELQGILTSINEEVAKLPQRYSDLWDIFREVKNGHDEEAFERLLADDKVRDEFYERLSSYSKTLAIALSSDKFFRDTDEEKIKRYKDDLRRLHSLRQSVQLRYAETIDYHKYESRIKKLLDTHIQANEVTQLNKPVDIFNEEEFTAVKQEQGIYSGKSDAARADIIAHATKKMIDEKMEEDPAFYQKFSKLIQQTIDDFRAHRISELDYLNRVSEIRDDMVTVPRDDIPESITGIEEACAYYGIAREYLVAEGLEIAEETVADMAQNFLRSFEQEEVVDFWDNENAINKVKGHMDDYFYDELKEKQGIELTTEQMDEIIEKTMQIARSRRR